MDEEVAASKVVVCKAHGQTIDYHLENFEASTNKFRVMLDDS